MLKLVRGLAGGTVLTGALTACGSGGAGDGGAAGAAGDTGGGQDEAQVVVTEDMIRTALISKATAP
ncbi:MULTISPECIES: hypothetical protein [Streptomyces]|uniref:Uncharacterized protein n=1 Tax=Streptomyces changanensis TaxID=2964669 RepID=A0ABY5N1J8_9ACTN|nr:MULTISPECIES: hypothetical protein [Streptomyces]UUS29793.1 hypothetical protein NRO40_02380 [Streptomyces changanensis]